MDVCSTAYFQKNIMGHYSQVLQLHDLLPLRTLPCSITKCYKPVCVVSSHESVLTEEAEGVKLKSVRHDNTYPRTDLGAVVRGETLCHLIHCVREHVTQLPCLAVDQADVWPPL